MDFSLAVYFAIGCALSVVGGMIGGGLLYVRLHACIRAAGRLIDALERGAVAHQARLNGHRERLDDLDACHSMLKLHFRGRASALEDRMDALEARLPARDARGRFVRRIGDEPIPDSEIYGPVGVELGQGPQELSSGGTAVFWPEAQ